MEFLPVGRSLELSKSLLRGAIDIHVHAGPHIFSSPRRVDPFEAASEARDAGMRAIVYMDVFEMSNGTAWMVNRQIRDFTTFGGLIMNTVYGGMNPRAVKTALNYGDGAKYISFGAHSTYYQAAREGHVVDGQFVPLSELYPKFRTEELDRCIRIPLEGAPGPELDEILALIAEPPEVYLNTGHVSVAEALRLVAEQIEQLGAEACIIASDFGVYTLPTPVEGFRNFIACLLDLGIRAHDIETLVKRNPARLLGLDPLPETEA